MPASDLITRREPVAIISGAGTALVELLVVIFALRPELEGPVSTILLAAVAILAPIGAALVARLYAWAEVSVEARVDRAVSLAFHDRPGEADEADG